METWGSMLKRSRWAEAGEGGARTERRGARFLLWRSWISGGKGGFGVGRRRKGKRRVMIVEWGE